MAKTPRIANPENPEYMIRPLVGPHRGQHIYAGADYDQAISEGWAVDIGEPHPESPGEEIEDLDAKIELANTMAAKWTAEGGPAVAPPGPLPKENRAAEDDKQAKSRAKKD
jgi:hypothetical protein